MDDLRQLQDLHGASDNRRTKQREEAFDIIADFCEQMTKATNVYRVMEMNLIVHLSPLSVK